MQNTLLAALLSFVLGFGYGTYSNEQSHKANQLEAVTKAQQETAHNIVESIVVSAKVEETTAASNHRSVAIRKQAAQEFNKQGTESNEAKIRADGECVIPGIVVGLLNNARLNSLDYASVSGNAEIKAASPVAVKALVDSDIEVVGMYHDLAARHDALVDFVESLIAKQAADK